MPKPTKDHKEIVWSRELFLYCVAVRATVYPVIFLMAYCSLDGVVSLRCGPSFEFTALSNVNDRHLCRSVLLLCENAPQLSCPPQTYSFSSHFRHLRALHRTLDLATCQCRRAVNISREDGPCPPGVEGDQQGAEDTMEPNQYCYGCYLRREQVRVF
jgi:hypothetical protein